MTVQIERGGIQPAVAFKPAWGEPEAQAAQLKRIAVDASAEIAGSLGPEIGALALADGRHPEMAAHGFCFRSQPLQGFGGGQFRFSPGSSAQPLWDQLDLVGEIVEAATRFVGSRERITRTIGELRTMAETATRRSPSFAPPEITAYAICSRSGSMGESVAVEMDRLGDGLVRGVDQFMAATCEMLADEVREALTGHARRAGLLASHRANRSRGRIDHTALRLMNVTGMDLDLVLDLLTRRETSTFHYGGRLKGGWDPSGILGNWRDGTVGSFSWVDDALTGEFQDLSHDVSLIRDRLTFKAAWPNTILASARGERLGRYLEHPLLSPDAIITDAGTMNGGSTTWLTVVSPTTALPDVEQR